MKNVCDVAQFFGLSMRDESGGIIWIFHSNMRSAVFYWDVNRHRANWIECFWICFVFSVVNTVANGIIPTYNVHRVWNVLPNRHNFLSVSILRSHKQQKVRYWILLFFCYKYSLHMVVDQDFHALYAPMLLCWFNFLHINAHDWVSIALVEMKDARHWAIAKTKNKMNNRGRPILKHWTILFPTTSCVLIFMGKNRICFSHFIREWIE